MLTPLVALAIALVTAAVLTPVVRNLAQRQGLLDHPNKRKVHDVALPRLGGVAIAVAFYLGLAGALLLASPGTSPLRAPDKFVALLLGAALVVGIGMIDDLFGMRARAKLLLQIAAASAVFLLGLSVDHLDGPWGRVDLGLWSPLVTVAWFIFVMNAINLIDGLDGLAAGVGLIGIGAFYLMGAAGDSPLPLALVLAAGAGGVLGFLPFNLYPASIIMGDTGSFLLGFILAAAGVAVTQSASPGAAPWAPLLVLGLALGDTAWAVIRRARAGASIFAPDKLHVHHRLLAAGLSQRSAVLVLWAISAGFGLLGVVTAR
jgi:UDP-GlcNAc:undecaprenyl-phosphate GlcNAc-1-phosphate transferase